MIEKKIRFYTIDAIQVATATGMGGRINTIMQTCFFAISGVLPREEAIAQIKNAIDKTYSKRGAEVVQRNFEAVDARWPTCTRFGTSDGDRHARPAAARVRRRSRLRAEDHGRAAGREGRSAAGERVSGGRHVAGRHGEMGEAEHRHRDPGLGREDLHPVQPVRAGLSTRGDPRQGVRSGRADRRAGDVQVHALQGARVQGRTYTIQVAPEDCTGCNLCVTVCPAKDRTNPRHKAIDMHPQAPLREAERDNYAFFLDLPDTGAAICRKSDHKTSQFLEPLFEYSGACAGCGETTVHQAAHAALRRPRPGRQRHRLLVDLRRQPADHAVHDEPRRPRAGVVEFAVRGQRGVRPRPAPGRGQRTRGGAALVEQLAGSPRRRLTGELLDADQPTTRASAQRERVRALRQVLAGLATPEARRLDALADYLVKKSVWLVGGDGWAYDIGYGGLDHVLASQRDVNILVLDTEVYSNTGGQQSKATPLGAVAKFASAGKEVRKKDLGLLANMYGHVYVARVALARR